MKKRTVLMVSIIAVAGFSLLAYFRHNGMEEPAIITSGIVEGTEVNISSKTAGRIAEICCREGDRVEQGSVVVRLEDRELSAAVQQAEAGVEKAAADVRVMESLTESAKAAIEGVDADIRDAEAEVSRAQVEMDEAEREMKRAKSLYDEELLSLESYEKARAKYDIAAAGYKSSRAKHASQRAKGKSAAVQLDTAFSRLNSSRKAVQEAEANLLYHRSRLDDTVISAPISGTVVFEAFEAGETVSPGVTILTLVDMDNLSVRTDLDETRIGRVILGGQAQITADAFPDRAVNGTISEIGRYAEFATQRDVIRGRQDIRTFRVMIKPGEHSGVLKPGMTVTVTISR